ncbi:MAG: ATP-binding protein [Candidatus Micrarchaeota archaeon]
MKEDYASIESTEQVPIPKDPLEQVIGQENAVEIARVVAKQKRNLLLVAPPGTGKSMLAQAIAFHLSRPTQEISVLHNPETPERPLVEVRTRAQARKTEQQIQQIKSRLITPGQAPHFVAERLGFRCSRCGELSKASDFSCPNCGFDKYRAQSPYGDLLTDALGETRRSNRVHTTRLKDDGREEVVVYERAGEQIRVLDQNVLQQLDALQKSKPRKVIVPFDRVNFISATGASETELLGDVRHDPYGGHQNLGTPPYMRVVPGAVHEAHEGVLFVDELSALENIQRYLLTAMQERKYSIVGRNPQSAGASVKVDGVPCDFVLVAASNINDLPAILPPLRSRVLGNGYEVLLDATMPDTKENRFKLMQFIAQEVRKDGKIPHVSIDGVESIIDEARTRARLYDSTEHALTLRLRDLSGVVRLAGDLAIGLGQEVIDRKLVVQALKRSKNIETQLQEKYGSAWNASQADFTAARNRDPKEVT